MLAFLWHLFLNEPRYFFYEKGRCVYVSHAPLRVHPLIIHLTPAPPFSCALVCYSFASLLFVHLICFVYSVLLFIVRFLSLVCCSSSPFWFRFSLDVCVSRS